MQDDYVPLSNRQIALGSIIGIIVITLALACLLYGDDEINKRMHGEKSFLGTLEFTSIMVGFFIILVAALVFCWVPILAGLFYIYCGPTVFVGVILQCFLMRPDHRRLPE